MFGFFRKKASGRISTVRSREILIGLLFVMIGMIVISLFSLPVWLSSFRMLPGGAMRVFLCYSMTVLFFFVSGVVVSYVYFCKRTFGNYANKIITDIIISYALRLIWIIVFFGSNSMVVSLISLFASIVFLVFSVISSFRSSVLITVFEVLMIFEELALLVYNFKFILIN